MKLSPASRKVGVRRLAALVASTLLAVAPAALLAGPPVAQADTGTITGKLVWGGGAIPEPKIDVAKDEPKVKDPICKTKDIVSKAITIDPKTKGIADAFVYIVKPVGDYSAAEKALLAKTPEVVIDQIGCEFVPYATFIQKDQKLVFKSSDPVGHNIRFTSFKLGSMNTMLPPNGKLPFVIKQEDTRPTEIRCDIHPWMAGYFLVLEHPLAAVTKADGTFEITGVPAGPQQLVVWHSDPGYVSTGLGKGQTVNVPAGGVVDAGTFTIKALKKK
jgi:hypothetical protein